MTENYAQRVERTKRAATGRGRERTRWAVIVRHGITRETYVVGPFDAAEDADAHTAGLIANDSARTASVVKLVERQPR